MEHIAEVLTPNCIAIFRFDPNNKKDVEDLEEILGEMADDGLVYGLEFHTGQ